MVEDTPARPSGFFGGRARALLAAVFALSGAGGLFAQTSSEYDVKAAFLFNFAQFVEWPESAFDAPGTPFTIGILGDDPFGATLDTIVHGETVNGRPFSVRRFRTLDDLEAAPCHILFVSRSEGARAGAILAALGDRAVLTVGDTSQFSFAGGVVQFLVINNRVQIRINIEAARTRQLRISSKLLRVAEVVGDPRSPG